MMIAGLAGLFLLPTPWNVFAVVAAAIIEVAEVGFWLRFLRRYRVSTGAEGMIGELGEAVEAIAAGSGRVRVHGELWAARADAEIAPGDRIRIAEVDGLTLVVEPVSQGTEKGP
jgi:membrane-bound serine protease (ClpP class)